jgi:hypothetical protein
MEGNIMQQWEHAKLVGTRLTFLGAGLAENRRDLHLSERGAWDTIRKDGWELVSVVVDPEINELVHYFKRPWE